MAKKHRRGGRSSSRLGGVLVLVAFLAVVVAAGVIIPLLTAKPEAPARCYSWQTGGQPPAVTAPRVHLPVLELPGPPPAPQMPQFSFSPEEAERLNQMLDTWAEEETYILLQPEEGEEPPNGAAGEGGQGAGGGTDENEAQPPAAAPGKPAAEPQHVPDGGQNVALWFLDIDSGAQYSYNAAHSFSYASLMKAPYAAWLYTLAAEGGCNLEESVEVQPGDIGKYAENTGVLKNMELPDTFTVETLMGYMLESSDTVALRVLLERYPAEGFRQWAAQQGIGEPARLNSVVSGQLTAGEAGVLLQAVYRVMQDNPHGPLLRQHMENAGNRMIVSAQWPVARKYGWDERAYHDMGVVYAPHPFLLVIMTDKWGGSYEERAMFGTLTAALEMMMAAKWEAFEAGANG